MGILRTNDIKSLPDVLIWYHYGCRTVAFVRTFYIFAKKRQNMGQTAFTVRMDADTKKKFDELCKDFGISVNTAFNMFARAVIRQERIPFDVESERQAKLQRALEAAERHHASSADSAASYQSDIHPS